MSENLNLVSDLALILISAGFCVGDFFLIRGIVGEANKRETIVYATIDDTVPWAEINRRYELIRQDGLYRRIYEIQSSYAETEAEYEPDPV